MQLYIVRAESVNTYFQTQKVYPQLQSLLLTEFSTNFQVLCYFLCLEFSDFSWPTNVWFLAWSFATLNTKSCELLEVDLAIL